MNNHLQRNIGLKEEIDQLQLNNDLYEKVFRDLEKINKWSLNDYLIIKSFKKLLNNEFYKDKNEIKIVDLGCGSAAHLCKISRIKTKSNHRLMLTGIDINPHLLALGKRKCPSNTQFLEQDLLTNGVLIPICDILLCSQFLYHFKDEELLNWLELNRRKIGHALIISEISRSRYWIPLFRAITWAMGVHSIVYRDGSSSIKKSWKKRELVKLLRSSNQFQNIIGFNFIFRYILICR